MLENPQYGAGLWVFKQFIDRYAADAYGPPVGTIEAIRRAGRVGELSAVDLSHPLTEPDLTLQQVKDALDEAGLRAVAITPDIFTGEFRLGAFTNPDAAVRQRAIDLCKGAGEVAHTLGADYVKLWAGQDGYDYPFQADYAQIWDYAVAGVREVASSDTSMQFGIEYKSKEPRTHMLFSTAARTLLAIQEVGLDNVGVIMDMGHSLFAKETPAEAVQMLHRYGKLTSVEINDNWREWDDDMTVGSVHLIETLEFFDALRRIGWNRVLMLDQFPFREDPVKAARASINTIKALIRLVDRIDVDALAAAQDRQDAIEAQNLTLNLLLGEANV